MRHILSLLAMALAAPAGAAAQTPPSNWPTKPIHVVVPLSPGSATDIVARIVLDQVGSRLGQTAIVENRTGAGNTIGMAAVAKADPDGYTILVNSSSHTVAPATHANLTFDVLRDLAAVVPLGNMPVVMAVSASKGYKDLHDFVERAKARPGTINFSSAGAGNSSHLNGERLRLAAGFEAVHLPLKGSPEALTEVLAGRADFYFSPLTTALSFIKDGRIQALAVSGLQRASALPEIPTTVEAGYPNSEYTFWIGMFVPRRTPPDIAARLAAETARVLESPVIREKLATLGVDPMVMTPAAFEAMVHDEVDINTRLVKAAGIAVN